MHAASCQQCNALVLTMYACISRSCRVCADGLLLCCAVHTVCIRPVHYSPCSLYILLLSNRVLSNRSDLLAHVCCNIATVHVHFPCTILFPPHTHTPSCIHRTSALPARPSVHS